MNRITKIFFCIISVCCIFVSICPISAFALPDTYYPIASDKPTVTDYSGYVELLFESKSTGQRFVSVVSWFFTPALNTSSEFYQTSDKPILTIVRNSEQFRLGVSTNDGVSGNMSFLTIDSGSQLYFGYISVPDDEATYYYNVTYGSGYSLVGMHYYGDFSSVNVSNGLSNEEFYVTYGADSVISHGINQLISGVYSLIDAVGQEQYAEQLQSIIDKLNNIDSSVDGFRQDYKTGLTQLFSWFRLFIDDLDQLVQNSEDIEKLIRDEVVIYLVSIDTWLYSINDWTMNTYLELYEIHSIVQSILDILNAQGENGEKLTQPDNSDMDNYYDVENGLLDGGNADVNGAVNVQINQNAMAVIWDMVERALNSHSKVFGMVLTVLSLGIIALILGR